MRKSIFAACVFAVVLIALPLSSFANDLLFFHNEGNIAGLQFYFGKPGLPVDLSVINIAPFYALLAEIETSGQEIAIIDQKTKDYYYYGNYDSGVITAFTTEGERIEIPMLSATLAEHFVIRGSLKKAIENPFTIEAPKNTSLIFKAVLGGGGNTVNFALVVRDGKVIFAGTY